jgi:hypothetical protein
MAHVDEFRGEAAVSGLIPRARGPVAWAVLLVGLAFLLLDTAMALACGWEPRTGVQRVIRTLAETYAARGERHAA